jgi:anti-sigma regulatory factor (Ser/Thr protein kinase)
MTSMGDLDQGSGASSVVTMLPGGARAPADARAAVASRANGLVGDDRLGELLVLTSEVVTNAILHASADEQVSLRCDVGDGIFRVGVSDTAVGAMPRIQARDAYEPGGLGLFLVDSLSERWGVERHWPTKEVWFEFLLSPASRGGSRAGYNSDPTWRPWQLLAPPLAAARFSASLVRGTAKLPPRILRLATWPTRAVASTPAPEEHAAPAFKCPLCRYELAVAPRSAARTCPRCEAALGPRPSARGGASRRPGTD